MEDALLDWLCIPEELSDAVGTILKMGDDVGAIPLKCGTIPHGWRALVHAADVRYRHQAYELTV